MCIQHVVTITSAIFKITCTDTVPFSVNTFHKPLWSLSPPDMTSYAIIMTQHFGLAATEADYMLIMCITSCYEVSNAITLHTYCISIALPHRHTQEPTSDTKSVGICVSLLFSIMCVLILMLMCSE